MKKIYNYISLKLSSLKIRIIIFLLFIYQFMLFFEIINQNFCFNIYDLIQKEFSYLPLFMVISLGYLLIIHDICNKTSFYKYLELKFKSKINLFNINVFVTFICSILYVALLNLFAVIEGIGRIDFTNTWSTYFYNNMNGSVNILNDMEIIEVVTGSMTPIEYTMITNLFVIFYLFFLGCLFLAINSITKKRNITFLIMIIINGINMGVDSLGKFVSNISFTHNIYLVTSSTNDISSNLFFIYRMIYWIILLVLAYLTGRYFVMKNDCKYEDN